MGLGIEGGLLDSLLTYKPYEKLSMMDLSNLEPVKVIYISMDNGEMLKDYGYGQGIYGFDKVNLYLKNEVRASHARLYKVVVRCDVSEIVDLCHTNDQLVLYNVQKLKGDRTLEEFVKSDTKYKMYNLNIMIPNKLESSLYDYMGEAYFVKDISLVKNIIAI